MRSSRLLSLVRWLVIQAKRLPTTLRERQVPCLLSPTSTRRVAYNSTRCPWVPLLRRRNSRLPLKYSAVFVIEVSVVEDGGRMNYAEPVTRRLRRIRGEASLLGIVRRSAQCRELFT